MIPMRPGANALMKLIPNHSILEQKNNPQTILPLSEVRRVVLILMRSYFAKHIIITVIPLRLPVHTGCPIPCLPLIACDRSRKTETC